LNAHHYVQILNKQNNTLSVEIGPRILLLDPWEEVIVGPISYWDQDHSVIEHKPKSEEERILMELLQSGFINEAEYSKRISDTISSKTVL